MIQSILKYVGWITSILFLSQVILSFLGYEIESVMIYLVIALVILFFTLFSFHQKMTVYVLKRLVGTLVTLVVVASLTFLLLRILPGGPFDQDKVLAPEVLANIEAKYNLNAPLFTQYIDYMKGIAVGDLGESYKYIGRSVSDIIKESFPATFQLGIYAILVSFLIGIPAGLFSASKHNTSTDNAIMVLAVSGVSLPNFLFATIFILIFSIHLDWLPAALWTDTANYILPSIVLGIRPAAVIARLTRASVLDVIRSDYIRTARSKGLAERVVLFKHVLKNSLLPVLTYSGPLIAGVITGSFIIEHIFAIPGMGKHLIQSVTNRDYPLILGLTLLYSTVLIVANLVVDLLYSFFDPRIKLS